MIKKFLAPVLWELQRANIVPLFLNIISLCLDALSPTLFQFTYPFKIEAFFLVPLVLLNSTYDTFIASKIPTMFSDLETGIQRGEYRRLGRTTKLHLVAVAIATWEVWAGALSCKSRTSWVNLPPFFSQSPDWLIMLGFNDTSTLVGHFVSSPREREKRDRRDSRRDEKEGQGRKRNRNESEETEEIKTSPPYPYLLQG